MGLIPVTVGPRDSVVLRNMRSLHQLISKVLLALRFRISKSFAMNILLSIYHFSRLTYIGPGHSHPSI